jgi:hypothetical protein
MRMRRLLVPVVTVGFCLALRCVSVQAQTTFTLRVDGCRAGCGRSLEFNISGDPIITISANPGLTSGFADGTGTSPGVFKVGPAPAHASAFGRFDYSVSCMVPSGCGHGNGHPDMGALSFVVEGVTVTDFTANRGGFFFAPDLQGVNGHTGYVADNAVSLAVVTPEPTSMLLFGSGLLALGAVLRRRKRSAISA